MATENPPLNGGIDGGIMYTCGIFVGFSLPCSITGEILPNWSPEDRTAIYLTSSSRNLDQELPKVPLNQAALMAELSTIEFLGTRAEPNPWHAGTAVTGTGEFEAIPSRYPSCSTSPTKFKLAPL